MATTTTIRSPADVVNASLVQIGWKNQVGDLLDGSAASQASLAIYGQTRDDLLRSSSWGFAQVTANLTLLKQPPPGGISQAFQIGTRQPTRRHRGFSATVIRQIA